jgi:pyruvate dehydrogenase E2 component (dihydrolipoamide acetyltransferase)
VIWGAEDRIIPARHARGLPATVRTHVLPGAGHMPHLEKASDVSRLLLDFIR